MPPVVQWILCSSSPLEGSALRIWWASRSRHWTRKSGCQAPPTSNCRGEAIPDLSMQDASCVWTPFSWLGMAWSCALEERNSVGSSTAPYPRNDELTRTGWARFGMLLAHPGIAVVLCDSGLLDGGESGAVFWCSCFGKQLHIWGVPIAGRWLQLECRGSRSLLVFNWIEFSLSFSRCIVDG
jgi:hypothetical protein